MPPGVVTVTSTTPANSDGEVATHEVADEQLTAVPGVAPKATVEPPVMKLEPVMATTVPPLSGPEVGETLVTDRRLCGWRGRAAGRWRRLGWLWLGLGRRGGVGFALGTFGYVDGHRFGDAGLDLGLLQWIG